MKKKVKKEKDHIMRDITEVKGRAVEDAVSSG